MQTYRSRATQRNGLLLVFNTKIRIIFEEHNSFWNEQGISYFKITLLRDYKGVIIIIILSRNYRRQCDNKEDSVGDLLVKHQKSQSQNSKTLVCNVTKLSHCLLLQAAKI